MKRSLSMLNRLKANLADFFQQADLVLLALCCTATLYGMALIASASSYMGLSKVICYVGVQGVALLPGYVFYPFKNGGRDHVRINYSFETEERLAKGLEVFRQVLEEELAHKK